MHRYQGSAPALGANNLLSAEEYLEGGLECFVHPLLSRMLLKMGTVWYEPETLMIRPDCIALAESVGLFSSCFP